MPNVVEAQIIHRRGTEAAWSTANPVLAAGEWGYDETNKIAKMGDGVSTWNALPGQPVPSEVAPLALGTAAAGSASAYARSDHIHPTTGLVLNTDARLTDARTPTAHTHSATDITSGTLPVARGGTGRDTLTAGRYLRGDGTGAVQSRTNSEVRDDLSVPEASTVVLRASGVLVVDHGGDAGVSRPSAAMVIWRGTVEPTGMLDGDIFVDLS